jgi:hypothetical protein
VDPVHRDAATIRKMLRLMERYHREVDTCDVGAAPRECYRVEANVKLKV